MTDALKLAEMQRTNIEYERQRHLANWLIKSSPHMANPTNLPPTPQQSMHQQHHHQPQQQQHHQQSANSKMQPLFFVGKINNNNGNCISNCPNPLAGTNLSISKSQQFNSQTNLPLQIFTQSQDGHKPKLRRFNSHDTSANMFSVADFENARLARRNELESLALIKQRHNQQNRYKVNSLSSGGGDCSTGDSKGSKFSNESSPEPLPPDIFLDRYSLPRVARLTTVNDLIQYNQQTIKSSSSGDSNTSSLSGDLQQQKKNKPVSPIGVQQQQQQQQQPGELFLLYRHIPDHKMYHGFNTKSNGLTTRKKGIQIPQEFPGYFSLINDRGNPTATMYTSIVQLVRERVYKFLSVDSLTAYTEQYQQGNDNFQSHRSHYVKGTSRAGQIYRLLAVFQDSGQEHSQIPLSGISPQSTTTNSPSKDSLISGTGREKEKGRYAQLLGENRQIVYVSLTAKGKFYEIEQSSGNNTGNSSILLNKTTPNTTLNQDCVHLLKNIINHNNNNVNSLPIQLKFISYGCKSLASSTTTTPTATTNNIVIPELLTITKITNENIIITCPIDDNDQRLPLYLRKLVITKDLRLIKSQLGYDNEKRMFNNLNIQNILKFCQFNYDNFIKQCQNDVLNDNNSSHNKLNTIILNKVKLGDGLRIIKPFNNFTKLLNRSDNRNHQIAHEKEDSIIFLSKNDLDNLEASRQLRTIEINDSMLNVNNQSNQQQSQQPQQQQPQQKISDKMKVFQPTTKKRWFRLGTSSSHTNIASNKNQLSKNNSFTSFDYDVQAKRTSIERYQDMSKLLQERFGTDLVLDTNTASNNDKKFNSLNTNAIVSSLDDFSLNKNKSSTATENDSHIIKQLKKSLSLQNIDFGLTNDKPDLVENLSNANTNNSSSNGSDKKLTSFNKQSFISEKLYTEFHVKTKQYSKSSSHLHQLLHFAVPQKMNVNETKRSDSSINGKFISTKSLTLYNSNNNMSLMDDLPYSSVRDSLVEEQRPIFGKTSRHEEKIIKKTRPRQATPPITPLTPGCENIYAEIFTESYQQPAVRHCGSSIRINVTSVPILQTNILSRSNSTVGNCVTYQQRCNIPILATSTALNDDNIYNTIK